MWCKLQCVGAEFGHVSIYLPLLDGTVKKLKTNIGGMAHLRGGCFCIRLYTILIRLYALYTVHIQYRGLLYASFPHPMYA
jgi:hypothetical protein